MRRFLGVALLLVAAVVQAQIDPAVEYTRVLLPVEMYVPQPGAFDSSWVTRLTIVNGSATPVAFYPFDSGCRLATCAAVPLPPQLTFSPSRPSDVPGFHGSFVLVERGRESDVQIALRAQDLSRQSQTWGTSLPTPAESEFRTGGRTIVDVPTGAEFRSAFRLYGLTGFTTTDVRIRVYGTRSTTAVPSSAMAEPDILLTTFTVRLVPQPDSDSLGLKPTFAEVLPWPALPQGDWDRLRIAFEPVLPNARIWGFVSVTNDETQHVTVLSPR